MLTNTSTNHSGRYQVEVFLCTCAHPEDLIRWHLFQAVRRRWLQEPDVDLKVIAPSALKPDYEKWGTMISPIDHWVPTDGKGFQGDRRTFADSHARTDFVLADDDCMPMGRDFVSEGMRLLHTTQYPPDRTRYYATISARLWPEPQGYYATGQHQVIDHPQRTSGGITFVTKGVLSDVLPHDGTHFDDSLQTRLLRESGHPVGIFRDLYTNHLGAGLSTVWPESYTGKTQINDYKG